MSEKREDIQLDIQEEHQQRENCGAKSWNLRHEAGNQELSLVEGLTPSERKITANRGEAGNVEALAPNTTERIDRILSGVAREKRPQNGSDCSGWKISKEKERNTETEKDVASKDLERRKR
jgi:hypothetical protein